MLPLLLLLCVVGVGLLMTVAMAVTGIRHLRHRRDARTRAKLLAHRMAEAKRLTAERAAKQAAAAAAVANVPAPAPLPRGELTAVISLLEQSTRFKRAATPVPVAPSRMPKGSVPPPIPANARARAPLPIVPASRPPVSVSTLRADLELRKRRA